MSRRPLTHQWPALTLPTDAGSLASVAAMSSTGFARRGPPGSATPRFDRSRASCERRSRPTGPHHFTTRRTSMPPRIDARHLVPDGYRALLALERYLGACSLDKTLLDLVRLRVSQMNGCAYCLDMHWKDL